MKIQFSAAKALEAIPDGRYALVFVEYKIKVGKESKEPYAALVFTVDSDDEYNGRKLFKNLSFQPQAMWKTKQTLVNMGADPDELVDDVDIEDILNGLIGNACAGDVIIKEYNNKLVNELSEVVDKDDDGWQ